MMSHTTGSIVLQPNSGSQTINTSSETTTSQTSSLAVRTLQGIRVIPVTATSNVNTSAKIQTPITAKTHASNTQLVVGTQQQSTSASIPSHHQFVARIITTAQANRANVPQTQIVIPSTSALQPLFLTHSSQTSSANETLLQQMTSKTTSTPNELQKAKVAIALPHRSTQT